MTPAPTTAAPDPVRKGYHHPLFQEAMAFLEKYIDDWSEVREQTQVSDIWSRTDDLAAFAMCGIIDREVARAMQEVISAQGGGKVKRLNPVSPAALLSSFNELTSWLAAGATLSDIENEVSFSESILLVLHEMKRVCAEVAEIEVLFADGQGEDDGSQILPDFTEGMSIAVKVESCLLLLEKRRDVIAAYEINQHPDPMAWMWEEVNPCPGSSTLKRFATHPSTPPTHAKVTPLYARPAPEVKDATPGWPDPLESPLAQAIRDGKIDDVDIRDLFDKMERELQVLRRTGSYREVKPTPAPAASDELVERLRAGNSHEHTHDPDKEEAAARIEALEATFDQLAKENSRKAARIEADAAEMERKDGALLKAFEYIGGARGTSLALAMSGRDNPKIDTALMKLHDDGLRVEQEVRAALRPAKGGRDGE